MFEVQQKQCSTCIYRKDSPLDLKKLEEKIKDPYIGFKTFRQCHHSNSACCAAFWAKNKDNFPMGQIAQRLNLVTLVNHDKFKE